ncbi:peptidylprolyl isomerase [Winogradskyella psychrotolerans]|uniref:peptidylprolyl isomerase n=1 Tax=Winogradskyella psychrotolerans TaxID=1344585 RepID=UPI001C06B46D|nr:peptidylprolyl isomerase [Winogradskyella psychrotolerans]MBU2928340.1 peptidylprolyl isomerase [Winogradskyella psychrotolerans]
MKLIIKCLCLVFFALNFSFSQDKDAVLLKVNGEPIMASEFLRVYNKNLDLVQDESQKDVDGYLKLFTEYQLKLKEAKRLKLDEDKTYQREFSRYKKQLISNYISENKVTDALVVEAYERSNIDINASHILVRLDASAKDTLNAYNEVLALRKRVLEEGYDKVKAEMHNGSTIFLEDLGYFSAFKMVYAFETAAYNTTEGEISMPFRTQFGYHVVKVNDRRPSRGTVTVAHIMVNLNSKDSLANPEGRINDIYKKVMQGESFDALAKQFSEDKSSAREGGKIAPFKSGQLSSPEFEDVAFNLEKDGDISEPFKTAYGWHIVKRLNLQPIEPLENVKSAFESKVKRDSRSQLIQEALVNKLKSQYEVTYNDKAKPYFTSILSKEFYNRQWNLPADFKADETLFTIKDTAFTYEDFGKHLMNAQRIYARNTIPFTVIIDKEFDSFFEKSILQYREDNLEVENLEYANILKEYRDGLLLFDLMEKEVWNKASKDSVGIETYYDKNKEKYQWTERIEAVIASSADKSKMKKILKMMKKGKSEDEIKDELNTQDKQNVIFTKGTYAIDNPILPSDLEVKQGVSDIYKHHESYHVIDVLAVLPAGQKTLEEAKGNVINDYQAEIEANWVNDLYERFDVEVNQETLKAIKAKIEN